MKKNVPPEIVFSQIKYFLVDLHECNAKLIIDNLSDITLKSHHGGEIWLRLLRRQKTYHNLVKLL